jgi:hypothetical protein
MCSFLLPSQDSALEFRTTARNRQNIPDLESWNMTYDGRLLSGVTVFMAVVEAGTMTRAADALGMTQSGVGRSIQRLEARIGARLLDRTTRTLRLTDEGRRFWERVGPHIDGIEEAALDAASSTEKVRGRLRVNVDPSSRAWCWRVNLLVFWSSIATCVLS